MRNIITVLVTILSLVFISSAEASKLYLLCEGEMNDSNYSAPILCGIRQAKCAFTHFVPEDNLVVYSYNINFADSNTPDMYKPKWAGPDLSKKNINVKDSLFTAIHNCPAGPDDAIIIFWIGHGARDENGHYLSLLPNQGPNKIYRSEIITALKNKNVRLAGLISDTCNVSYGTFCAPYMYPVFPTKIPPLYKKLFFDTYGILDINSSSPNQLAMVEEDGPIFTKRFSNYLTEHQNDSLLWDELIANLNNDTSQYCKSIAVSNEQTICVMSLPRCSADLANFQWTQESTYHPENTDVIVEFNGLAVLNEADFRQKIAQAEKFAIMKIIDHRTGLPYHLKTQLLPKEYPTRLGIYVKDNNHGNGVVVTNIMPTAPGYRCQTTVQSKTNTTNPANPPSTENWSKPSYRPEVGDRIVEFNGSSVLNQADFVQKVNNSGPNVQLTLIDENKGQTYKLRTQLNPTGTNNRLGIYTQDTPHGGVVVIGIIENSPGTRCQMLTSK